MDSYNKALANLKVNLFSLIEHIGNNIAFHVNQDRIDSQAIFAFTKLIDSAVKLELLIPSASAEKDTQQAINDDDQELLLLHEERSLPQDKLQQLPKTIIPEKI